MSHAGDNVVQMMPDSSMIGFYGEQGGRFGYATGSSIPRGIGNRVAWRDPHPCLRCGAAVLLPGVHLAWHFNIEGDK